MITFKNQMNLDPTYSSWSESFLHRLRTETLYFYDDQEECFVRSDPHTKKYFARRKGGEEFELPYHYHIVVRAVEAQWEVTAEDYYNS